MSDYYRRLADHYAERVGIATEARGGITAWLDMATNGQATPEQALTAIRDALARWDTAEQAEKDNYRREVTR